MEILSTIYIGNMLQDDDVLKMDDVIQFLGGRDPLLTVQDICTWTGYSQSAVYQWIEKGLPVEQGNGVSRVRLTKLNTFLSKNTFQPPPSIVPETMRRDCNQCGASTCGRCGKAACQGCA